MKLAFISDVHGNAVALEAVLADTKNKKIDTVYVLGDLCYRGPEPKRSLDLIRSLNTKVIKGNADEWVVRGVRSGEVPDQVLELMNRERDWTYAQLDRADIEYLASLPVRLDLTIGTAAIHAFHATPQSLFEVVAANSDDTVIREKLMNAAEADVYVYAHIHKPYIRYFGGKVIMNIGSVGLPFDGMCKASYGIVEIEGERISVSIERVPYHIEEVINTYGKVNYPNAEMMTRIIRTASL